MSQTIGLIAGGGLLPVLTARGIRAAGARVACVGLRGQYDAALPELCDYFAAASIGGVARWIRLLRRQKAREAVMVGKVAKTRMYDPFAIMRNLPSWSVLRAWYTILRHDRRSDRLLTWVADELARHEINLIDTTKYIPEHMADEGVMTSVKPSSGQLRDIEFALPVVLRMGDLDIGQAVAVKDAEIIAVEAIEGTDAMIRRAGELCRAGKWVLLKVAKPRQDMRFDVPAIGVQTIINLQAAGAACLAIQAGKTIMLEKPAVIAAANKAGITIVGIRVA